MIVPLLPLKSNSRIASVSAQKKETVAMNTRLAHSDFISSFSHLPQSSSDQCKSDACILPIETRSVELRKVVLIVCVPCRLTSIVVVIGTGHKSIEDSGS